MAHIKIKNLTFSYPGFDETPALDDVSLDIPQGQYVTLCGRSGSGKSTLLNQLKTVLTPNGKRTGEIFLDDTPLEKVDLRTQAMEIGYVMQDPDSQIVTDKVWHELAFGLENLGIDQSTMRTRVAEMASYFGIQGWFHKDVSNLSGGQKQLLNLASIMAMQPGVLILDEPTSQLDPIAASDFLNTVKKINIELGTTIIITEHRLEDIFHASDKVVVLERGRVLLEDAPVNVGRKLKEKNDEMFTAMPAPVRIYYGTKSALSGEYSKSPENIPLTVREGRTWLNILFEGQKELITSSDEEYYDENKIQQAQEPAIRFKDVWVRYDRDLPDILKGATFDVPRNKIFAVVGGNGAGKSTSLRTICRMIKPYRGKIFIDGKKIEAYNSAELFRGKIAMLPQDPKSLFVKTTAREELEEMLGVKKAAEYEKEVEKKGTDNVPLDPHIAEVASECEITGLLNMHPYDLSGGEQQRLALAKVLLTNPEILLLDEPTKGLDNFFKLHFAQILNGLKDRGVTILMVSHDVEFCARHADIVGMFFDGDLITTNTPDKFFGQNSFYTTAANRMSRHLFTNAITDEDVVRLCIKNLQKEQDAH